MFRQRALSRDERILHISLLSDAFQHGIFPDNLLALLARLDPATYMNTALKTVPTIHLPCDTFIERLGKDKFMQIIQALPPTVYVSEWQIAETNREQFTVEELKQIEMILQAHQRIYANEMDNNTKEYYMKLSALKKNINDMTIGHQKMTKPHPTDTKLLPLLNQFVAFLEAQGRADNADISKSEFANFCKQQGPDAAAIFKQSNETGRARGYILLNTLWIPGHNLRLLSGVGSEKRRDENSVCDMGMKKR